MATRRGRGSKSLKAKYDSKSKLNEYDVTVIQAGLAFERDTN